MKCPDCHTNNLPDTLYCGKCATPIKSSEDMSISHTESKHLGKICEQQGNTAKAIEHYQKFLSIWKDADPGVPEVEDAKKRLAGLKST